jgi:hypothetical protein
MANPYKQLIRILPKQTIETGEIVAVVDDGVLIDLPTGARIKARGSGTVGDVVYVRDGAIEGDAPILTGTTIYV